MMKNELKKLFDLRIRMKKGDIRPGDIEDLVMMIDRAEDFICSIDDTFTRQALKRRYIMAMKWDDVADCFGFYSSDAVRKMCDRALRSAS